MTDRQPDAPPEFDAWWDNHKPDTTDAYTLAQAAYSYALAAPQSAQPAADDVRSSMQTLVAALKTDPDYAWTWHCNVAMAALDEGLGHYEANKAAARFMSWLAQIDTTTHPGFPKAPTQPAAAPDEDAILSAGHPWHGATSTAATQSTAVHTHSTARACCNSPAPSERCARRLCR